MYSLSASKGNRGETELPNKKVSEKWPNGNYTCLASQINRRLARNMLCFPCQSELQHHAHAVIDIYELP